MAQEAQDVERVQQLDRRVRQGHQLRLAGRHGDAVLPARGVRHGGTGEHDDKARRRARRAPAPARAGSCEARAAESSTRAVGFPARPPAS